MTRFIRTAVRFTFACVVVVGVVSAGSGHAAVVDLALVESACISNPAHAESWRVLLRFAVPDGLEGATVDLATLRIELSIAPEGEREVSIEAFPVTRAWSAEGVAWDDDWESGDGAWNPRRGSISSSITAQNGRLAIDVTPMVIDWLQSGSRAPGLVLAPFAGGSAHELTAPLQEATLRVWYAGPREREARGETR
jgi:hypothetical protein